MQDISLGISEWNGMWYYYLLESQNKIEKNMTIIICEIFMSITTPT